MSFLPISKKDMEERGWSHPDFLLITGDAYVDHPSFGHAIISRVLEKAGFRVGIISQPDWHKNEEFLKLGTPEYGVLITAGVMDSMVAHYSGNKIRRKKDNYSPGDKIGLRPDRAVIVYANKIREVFGDIPIIIGGVEASLRRFAHYDFWQNKVRGSILLDSSANLLVYGSGDGIIIKIANLLKKGVPINKIKSLDGTAYLCNKKELPKNILAFVEDTQSSSEYVNIPSHNDVAKNKSSYAKAFMMQYREQNHINGKMIIQQHGDRYLVQNKPEKPLSTKDLDAVYALPYERNFHPIYKKDGGIAAIKEVQFSVTSHRGCFGGCSFCSITFHQGRNIRKRSQESILNEVEKLTQDEDFKGYIHDIGGPTANFRNPSCTNQEKHGMCKDKQCLYKNPCKNLKVSHREYLELLRKARSIKGVKKVFIRSGIRYDYLMKDKDSQFLNELIKYHISGQLKVAPEHTSEYVLDLMGKPNFNIYKDFKKKYEAINKRFGLNQFLVPYYIAGHPGSTMQDAIDLAIYLKETKSIPEQVQQFYPTPGTLSTTMYYTGIDPRNMKEVYIPNEEEIKMQRALLQFSSKRNKKMVIKALKYAGREDLIGFTGKCLVQPLVQDRVQPRVQNRDNNKINYKHSHKKKKRRK